MNRRYNCFSSSPPCPSCKEKIEGDARKLIEHYLYNHGRKPTDGEIHQFRTYRYKDFKTNRYPDNYKKSFHEVIGGLPSLGKKK